MGERWERRVCVIVSIIMEIERKSDVCVISFLSMSTRAGPQ